MTIVGNQDLQQMIPDAFNTHTLNCADIEKTWLIVLALQIDFVSSAHVETHGG